MTTQRTIHHVRACLGSCVFLFASCHASVRTAWAQETAPSVLQAPPQSPTPIGADVATADDVVIRADKPAPGRRTLSRADVREIPGAFGDPFRAIEALPGVTPLASGVPFFYVRGAPPGNVGYYLDGVRVPYLFHVGIGPSVIHPALIDHVDLYSGGYPARFGRYAGGIVSGETTQPRADLHGEGNVRLFDLGALAETGFADGKGSVLVGGRYSYTATLVSLLAPDVALDYRDAQFRASYELGSRDRVSVFAFGSYDILGEVKNNVRTIFFGSEFYRTDFRYDHRFGRDSTVRAAVTLGLDQTRISEERNGQTRIVAPRLEIRHPLSDRVVVRGGADVMLERYGATTLPYDDPDNPEVQKRNTLFPARDDAALGAYVDAVIKATPEIEVTPGLRVDLFSSGRAPRQLGVDPRVAARFKIGGRVRIVHAHGVAHQPPSFVAPIPGLKPGTLAAGLQRSFQTSAGVEVDLPANVTSSGTLFHNAFFNMSDAPGTSADYDITATDFTQIPEDRRSRGSALGLEILLRRPFSKKLAGFVAYTLSRSTRSIGRETFPSGFDRSHVVNVALSYDLGRGWRAGARYLFYTGVPVSRLANGLIVPPRSGSPERSPVFNRIDLRGEKRWKIGDRGWIALVFELMNATLSSETFASARGAGRTFGPITVPSIGVEGGL
jgi:hypothetical protein